MQYQIFNALTVNFDTQVDTLEILEARKALILLGFRKLLAGIGPATKARKPA